MSDDTPEVRNTYDWEKLGRRKRNTRMAEHRKHLKFPPNPKDIPTAIRYSSWIVIQIGRGNLTPAEGRVMLDGLKELRALLDVRDADAKLAEAKATLAQIKALKAK